MHIKLMADYECYPLWDLSPEGGDISPGDLPISKCLKEDICKWAARFDATLNRDDPVLSGFDSKEEEGRFSVDGERLAVRLRSELGGEYEVFYQEVK
ncbi:hypothetical protein ACPRNU_21135 [Chromobacterium vaccinii]|uniref:hypothetical protein n=1 Tax=Chromobacterium vaccinii TaxID=1108595 RepID=UPI003C7344D0